MGSTTDSNVGMSTSYSWVGSSGRGRALQRRGEGATEDISGNALKSNPTRERVCLRSLPGIHLYHH